MLKLDSYILLSGNIRAVAKFVHGRFNFVRDIFQNGAYDQFPQTNRNFQINREGNDGGSFSLQPARKVLEQLTQFYLQGTGIKIPFA